jgi:hypothetical protein
MHGVNYSNAQSNWVADIAYFLQNKISVRPHQPRLAYPWAAGTPNVNGNTQDLYAFWRSCAIQFSNAGIYVTFGPSFPQNAGTYGAGGLTAAVWNQYVSSTLSECAYLVSIGANFNDYSIGNELENYVDDNTLTAAQLRTNAGVLAAQIKAIPGWTMPVSWSCDDGYYTSSGTKTGNWAAWVSNGLQGLDLISIHPYGNILTTQNYSYFTPGSFSNVAAIATAFGTQCYVSEFNLDSTGTDILKLSTEQAIMAMRYCYATIKSSGIQQAMVYTWCQYLNNTSGDQGFVMQNTDGSFNPMWDVLLGNDRRTFVP